MFTNDQLRKYAQVLTWGLTKARMGAYAQGDVILVRSDISGLPLTRYVIEEVLAMGCHPVVRVNADPGCEQSFFANAEDFQLTFKTPGDRELYESLNGLISIISPASLTHLKDIDPGKIARSAVTRKYLRDILDEREARGAFGWTLCLMPTPALAEHAGLDARTYADQIVKAVYLDDARPVDQWESIFTKAEKVKQWLNSMDVEYYHVLSRHVDLRVTPGKDRQWIGVSGHNIPSFELFLSPDWRGTNGIYYADQPSFRSGNLVKGVQLEFKDGEVVGISAEQGEDFVRNQLHMDEGARRLGEFSLTDIRFSRIDHFMANTLFDENFGGEHGNCHVAVGASYADTYAGDVAKLDKRLKQDLGFNDSALHWDLVNTEDKKVIAHLGDGSEVLVYAEGRFQLEGV
ncbi:aminopeptidase [Desulfoplanes formicivorans]|uniref:Peptidase M29 n=1 Tax=Desulfoplanes formicivorans TaxID=1592317 RepID=A0A194AHT0_9BACT|nr:aminopeptidase [Desulfoplanes formicivorans]GAU08775.1 peptidase M29 [Desulfoplanes formicivorans]